MGTEQNVLVVGEVTDYPVFKNCRLEHCGVKVQVKGRSSNFIHLRCLKCNNWWIIDVD